MGAATKRFVIVGAGGFAREVKWLVDDINQRRPEFSFAGFVVSDLALLGPTDSIDQVLGDFSWLERHRGAVDAVAIGIGTPSARSALGRQLATEFPELDLPSLVHPTVVFDRSSSVIGRGAILCANVVGTVNLSVADYCVVNLSCTIGHEAKFGLGCVLNPTVNISGGVVLEDRVLVGTGAQVLQYLRVGRDASIGAGAVVTKDVAEGETVVGIPAKPLARR